ncbi:hypothetical protein ACEN9J_25840 [Variovorax sp. Varisp41]|uniref:hypothetical protein n=1 Tax=Variovorax sp. Varisp41 TaxID=3243033 RepID=UPI0039B38683
MLKSLRNTARKYGSKALVIGAMGTGAVSAFAQESTNPIVQMLDAVGLAGVVAGIVAAGLVIVSIALAEKAPTVAKRVIRRV